MLGLLLALGGSTGRAAEADAKIASYLRVDESVTNVVRLQTAVRRMVPVRGDGPTIWLGAVTHIGLTNYYRDFEELFATNDLVLFEAVLPEKKGGWSGPEFNRMRGFAAEAEESGSNLQTDLAKALGLAFQLEAIDYGRTNYRNSDLSMEAVQGLMLKGLTGGKEVVEEPQVAVEEVKEDAIGEDSFSQLMAIMQGRGFLGSLVKFGVQIIAANPRLQATTKLTFIEVLGRLKGDLAKAQALPPELSELLKVLIHRRNQKVTVDLRKELKRPEPPASIAVLYGAGHLDDLERRVREDLDYRPDGDVWLTAFEVDLAESGISLWEREMIRFVTEQQMQMLSPPEDDE